MKCEPVPPASVARLPLYMRGLRDLSRAGTEVVSSRDLAELTGLEACQIRRDLSYLGSFGKRGVGYDVEELRLGISEYLRLSRTWRVAVVGCGRLGSALATHLSVDDRNYLLCALFDCSTRRIGAKLAGLEIASWKAIPAAMRERAIDMAIVATPPLSAQGVADLIVQAGVQRILNFAPISLNVPDGVVVRTVDLADELQALSICTSVRRTARTKESIRPTLSWVTQ